MIFELGLFMGALGRERTFIVHSRTNPPWLPTDLAGVTPATFEERSNLDAALGPACTKLKRAVASKGLRPRARSTHSDRSEIDEIRGELSEQKNMLNELFLRLTASSDPPPRLTTQDGLEFLTGAWLSDTGSHYYCKTKGGQPYIAYCFEGNSEVTGEYFDIKRFNNELIGRFRWLDRDIRGFFALRMSIKTGWRAHGG